VLSEKGGPIKTSMGMTIGSEAFDETVLDTLIVGGGMEIEPTTPGMIRFVQVAPQRFRRVASICTGAFLLAEAGVLDGRRVTTHWYHARTLQARFPKLKMQEDRIFINDGPIWTSAGMTAGIDLALAMVEQDLGIELARMVAKKLVVYHRRSGGQSQFSALLELEPKSDRIQSALSYAKSNLHGPLSVAQLADAARLGSPKGTSPYAQTKGASRGQNHSSK
jgi:transcriptional regulator GlxA family with amidase domain